MGVIAGGAACLQLLQSQLSCFVWAWLTLQKVHGGFTRCVISDYVGCVFFSTANHQCSLSSGGLITSQIWLTELCTTYDFYVTTEYCNDSRVLMSLQQGRIAEAETAARRLWGKAKLETALADLKESNSDAGASEDAGWGDLFSRRYRKGTRRLLAPLQKYLFTVFFVVSYFWRTNLQNLPAFAYLVAIWCVCLGTVVGVGMSLFLFQQFAGINAVVYFSTNVFRSAGIASDVAASALVGAANVIGTISHLTSNSCTNYCCGIQIYLSFATFRSLIESQACLPIEQRISHSNPYKSQV